MRTLVLGSLIVLGLTLALLAQNAQETFQRAVLEEQSAGDLPEAIKLYAKVAKDAGKDRALAAKAMVRMAGAQEKLGLQADAESSYADVLRLYPEQRDQAVLAQRRHDAIQKTFVNNPQKSSPDVSSLATPLFETYCVSCHNVTKKSAGLDVRSLNAKNVGENTATWETIVRRLRARRDPPMNSPRPDDMTYRAVIEKLETALDGVYPSVAGQQGSERISDDELANRIAAFLWGSAPDGALLEVARRGRLQDPAEIERQVQRMLHNPKSVRLVMEFFEPWLGLNRPVKREIDPDLRADMATESLTFLTNQLRDNHKAMDLWTADYTFMNERLARHYGIAKVTGNEFRRVVWPDKTRAGILGQAGLLTLLSQGDRTSPTLRGIYVSTRFLGMQPADPPPNIPALPDRGPDPGIPLSERMAAHVSNPACSGCHVTFDPLGLALENFDNTGRWRTMDAGAPVKASGTFIDGSRFSGPVELRDGLLKYRDAYYANVTQQLLAFSLHRRNGTTGRVYDFEMPAVRAIVRSASGSEYRWSAIIAGIIASDPFQAKTIVP